MELKICPAQLSVHGSLLRSSNKVYPLSPGKKLVRKYTRAEVRRRIQKREYRKLQKIVPSVSKKNKVAKVTVIEEAIKYIDELHNALAVRLQSSSVLPKMDLHTVQQLAQSSFLQRGLPTSNLPFILPGMAHLPALSHPLKFGPVTSSSRVNTTERLRT